MVVIQKRFLQELLALLLGYFELVAISLIIDVFDGDAEHAE
jgi:hypothetical protein